MQKILLLLFILGVGLMSFIPFRSTVSEKMIDSQRGEIVVEELGVEEVLLALGAPKSPHYLKDVDAQKAEIGRQLLFEGIAPKSSSRVSNFFNCTDCHSFESEFNRPTETDPQARLDFAIKENKPFLPGSTLWGIYNRKHWYNGDYKKKYGDIINNAKDTLTNAIQVCAKYCSSGRFLKNWEVEGIMHYFKKFELKIKDLKLDANTLKNLSKLQQLDENEKKQLIETIDNAHITAYPATFTGALDRDKRKMGTTGNAENGRQLFDKSCLFCHQNGRVTYLKLEKDDITANMFINHLDDYTDLSLYQVLRYGTYPKDGRRQYMPLYTKEKMSDQQIEDIISYLKTLTNKK